MSATRRQEEALAGTSVGLPPWAVAEAVRYFRRRLVLEAVQSSETKAGDMRTAICMAQFVSLVRSWRPDARDFWRQCEAFNKEWAPGPRKGARPTSPRARPLCAMRLGSYLARLVPAASDDESTEGEDFGLSPEIRATVARFGIRVSDIRLTCESVFRACREWTGLDWQKASALDPCPWPVPRGLDGLHCCWRSLAAGAGHQRVYLNPPWSQLDRWIQKAIVECQKGLQVPLWMAHIAGHILHGAWLRTHLFPARHGNLRVCTRLLPDAEFAHPLTGSAMPPLDVVLLWMRWDGTGADLASSLGVCRTLSL